MCIQEIVRVCACTWCGCPGENLVHFCQANNVPGANHQLERWEWPLALCLRCQGHEYEHREILVRPSAEWPFWGPSRGALARRFNFARTDAILGRRLPPKTLPEQSQIVFNHLVAPPMVHDEQQAAASASASASAPAPFARTDLWDPRDPNAPVPMPSRINEIIQMAMTRREPISIEVKPKRVLAAEAAAAAAAAAEAAKETSGEHAASSVQASSADWADMVEQEEEQEQGSGGALGEISASALNISAAADAASTAAPSVAAVPAVSPVAAAPAAISAAARVAVPLVAVPLKAAPVPVVVAADEAGKKPAMPARQIPVEFPRAGTAPALTTPPIKLALAPSSPSRPSSPKH